MPACNSGSDKHPKKLFCHFSFQAWQIKTTFQSHYSTSMPNWKPTVWFTSFLPAPTPTLFLPHSNHTKTNQNQLYWPQPNHLPNCRSPNSSVLLESLDFHCDQRKQKYMFLCCYPTHICVCWPPPLHPWQIDAGEPAEPLAKEQDAVGQLHRGVHENVANIVNLQDARTGLVHAKEGGKKAFDKIQIESGSGINL